MLKKTSIGVLTLAAAILCGVGVVNAHPELQSAEPAIGSTTTASPKQIRITFNERVVPQFSGIELRDRTEKTIATGKAATDPATGKYWWCRSRSSFRRATTRSNGTQCRT